MPVVVTADRKLPLGVHRVKGLRPKSKPKVMDKHRAKSGSSDTLYAQICQKALYVSSYIRGFLLAFFITCPMYMYTWLFYPATCVNLLSSFVSGCFCTLIFFLFFFALRSIAISPIVKYVSKNEKEVGAGCIFSFIVSLVLSSWITDYYFC